MARIRTLTWFRKSLPTSLLLALIGSVIPNITSAAITDPGSITFDAATSYLSTSGETNFTPNAENWTIEGFVQPSSTGKANNVLRGYSGANGDVKEIEIYWGPAGYWAMKSFIGGTETNYTALNSSYYNTDRWVHFIFSQNATKTCGAAMYSNTSSTNNYSWPGYGGWVCSGLNNGSKTARMTSSNKITKWVIGSNELNVPFQAKYANVRISNVVRYSLDTKPPNPTTYFKTDANTLLLLGTSSDPSNALDESGHLTVTPFGNVGTSTVYPSLGAAQVTPSLQLSLPNGASTATYGTAVTISAQTSTAGSVTFKAGGTTITGCLNVVTAASVATCSWTPSSANTSESLTADFVPTNSATYASLTGSGLRSINVAKVPLVITASSPTVGFGDAVPSISPSYATFVNGDTANVVTGLTCTTAYTTATSVGATPSTSCSGASASNYSISYVPGAVTVARQTQAALSLVSDSFDFGTTLTLAGAGGNGGGDYSYSLSSSGTAGCSRSGAVLSASSAGSCTVSVTRDSSTNYESKTQLFTIVVNLGDQSLLMIDDVSGDYGSDFPLSTSGGSGIGVVSYTVTSTGTAGCSLAANGTDLVATSAGTCTVKATKATSGNYKARSTTDATITFSKISQPTSLTLSDTSVAFGATLTLSASGGNGGGALSYDVTAPGSAGCSLASATLSVTAGGTCIVTATRATTTNYLERTDSFTITVSRANQATLSITDVNGAYGEPLILSTTGGSGSGTVSYAVSAGTAGCSLLSGAVTVSSIGTCSVTATKASDNSYNQKSSVLTTLTFVRGAQSSLALVDDGMLFGDTLTLATTGGNGDGAVSYVLATGTAGCTVNSGIVSAAGIGTCSVTVTKASSANYLAKVQTFTITVGVSPQSALTISTTTGVVGTSIALRFTGGSGNGAVTWAITEIGTARCGLIGSTLLAASVGTCEVKVTKAAEDNYLVATATQSVTITAVPKETKDSGQIVTPTISAAPTTTIATTTTTTTTTIPSAVGTPDAEIAKTGASSPTTTTTTSTISKSRSTTTTTVESVQDALMKRVAGVGAGEALIVQGDSSFAATVVRQNNSLVMTAGTFKATIRGIDKAGNVLPLDSRGDIRIPKGGSIAVDMGRYAANSDIFVWMFSTPRLLEEQHANNQGNIVSKIETPADIEEGLHRVAFVGKNAAGRDITFMVGVIVAEPSQLSTASKVLIAIPLTLAVFAGFLLPTTLHRRRRRQRVVLR